MHRFWQYVDAFPPCLVRCLAKKRTGPITEQALSTAEIASASGLDERTVELISQATNWAGIDVPTMRAFLIGCRMDFENVEQMRRAREYVSEASWRHLCCNPRWETYYRPLLEKVMGR